MFGDRLYDPLALGWRLRCPQQGTAVAVNLTGFRRLQRLAGPSHPAVFQVTYLCPDCQELHPTLLTEGELNVAPVLRPLPVHHDLMLGSVAWDAALVESAWVQALRRHRWPLNLQCSHERLFQVPGWPSLLRALEPNVDASRFLVAYDCSRCAQPDELELSAGELALAPQCNR